MYVFLSVAKYEIYIVVDKNKQYFTNFYLQLAPGIPLNISTMVVSRVSKLPYIGSPYKKPLKEHEIKISAIPIPEPKPDIVPLWIFVLAACCGVLILLLLILLLYKVRIQISFLEGVARLTD